MNGDRVAPRGAASTIGSPHTSLSELISALIGDLRTSLAARFDIAQIEARQSLGFVLRSFGAACAAVLLVLSAWWSICAALVVLAVDLGAPWGGALIAAAVANAALAIWAARYARERVRAVGMPHTRRLFLDTDQGRPDIRPEPSDAVSDR
jgi:hypothetical protein